MTTSIHHPFLNVPGTIGKFQMLEDGRQAYVSWARSQPDQERYAGEICRKNGDVAVFLGTENNNDYFMHIMGGEVPDDATAIDFDQQEFVQPSDEQNEEAWLNEDDQDDQEFEDEDGEDNKKPASKFSQFDRNALAV